MKGLRKLFKIERGQITLNMVRTAQGKPGKPGKGTFQKKKFRENLENVGNFILRNISDQIGGALRINEQIKINK